MAINYMNNKNFLNLFLTAILVIAVFAGGYYLSKKIDFNSEKVENNQNKSMVNPVRNSNTNNNNPENNNIKQIISNGVNVEILKQGEGESARNGDKVTVHYIGTLTDGEKFDSSIDRGQPFSFVLGAGQVIQGWEQGLLGMKVGEKRKLTIPSELGYGERGVPGAIPPGATLVFEVELLKIN